MAVAMVDIEGDALDDAVAEMRALGGNVEGFRCDVSDNSQVEAMRDQVFATFGGAHVLCNNAGVASGRPIHKEKPATWDWVVGVNLLGVAYCTAAFVPHFIERGEGHVVNTASEAGLVATAMLGSYHATKYAVVGLSEALSMELEGTGVNVSCLCPELVDTKIFESTRNAPAALGIPKPQPVDLNLIASFMNTVQMDPNDVAGRVLYAIKAEEFWILTHQKTHGRLIGRNDDLAKLRRPRSQG
jgi:NAD(P)-dependent dehydrogenase (short-subunit alcohol dehydrogenase family)